GQADDPTDPLARPAIHAADDLQGDGARVATLLHAVHERVADGDALIVRDLADQGGCMIAEPLFGPEVADVEAKHQGRAARVAPRQQSRRGFATLDVGLPDRLK